MQRTTGGRAGKLNGKKSEREINHEKLWTLGNNLKVAEVRWVGGWGNWMMGIEDPCCDRRGVLHATNESLNTTSKTRDVLYVG